MQMCPKSLSTEEAGSYVELPGCAESVLMEKQPQQCVPPYLYMYMYLQKGAVAQAS